LAENRQVDKEREDEEMKMREVMELGVYKNSAMQRC
jgi:hypothetical protein